MRSCDQVPDELWLQILQDLPKTALRNVSGTNRTLSRISRPLLFAEFTFCPYAVTRLPKNDQTVRAPDVINPIPLNEIEREAELDRLNFWSSPEIAPWVRSCTVRPLRSALEADKVEESGGNGSALALLDIFFRRLPRFTGLCHLHAFIVHFTPLGLANLRQLPSLSSLDVIVCTLVREAGDAEWASLDLPFVTRFQFRYGYTYLASRVQLHSSLLDPWMSIIRLDKIVELNLGFGGGLFSNIARTLPAVLPSVKLLTLHAIRSDERLSTTGVSNIRNILPRCPRVEVLKMEGSWAKFPMLPGRFRIPRY
ncbi:L-aminoadipate-semialdehyde dehydrogenase [Favolaschia claudopus]|uniref:L-aminoadipate-semialdehyde dehydrogenase n=1 Tax=Favolaschia claudopus TaxID=2862362 RepID=A0AAW0CY09_9AGAR